MTLTPRAVAQWFQEWLVNYISTQEVFKGKIQFRSLEVRAARELRGDTATHTRHVTREQVPYARQGTQGE